jgi:hypothetical protein
VCHRHERRWLSGPITSIQVARRVEPHTHGFPSPDQALEYRREPAGLAVAQRDEEAVA